MAKQRELQKCLSLTKHRPLSRALSQNDASFCTDPTFSYLFQAQKDPVMAEAGALAAANPDSHLLHKIWQKLSTLDKIEHKVDRALTRLDRLEKHAQEFSHELEPSHSRLKEELLLTKEVIQDIIPNLPDFSEDGLDDDDDDDVLENATGTITFDESTLENVGYCRRDDIEPELFFMEEEMGDICTSLHTPTSSPDRKFLQPMYLVDHPSACTTPFSETYDVLSPMGAPSEFYPNLSEISGSNDHDDFTVKGASLKDASEVDDEDDYYVDNGEEEECDSEDEYWRLCPNEQGGMSNIQRTSIGLLEQISRLQEELGESPVVNQDSTEEDVEQSGNDESEYEYNYDQRRESELFPDIHRLLNHHDYEYVDDDDDALEMPRSIADASDVADLEDVAVKLRHTAQDDEELTYMTIEEFQMISVSQTSRQSGSETSVKPPSTGAQIIPPPGHFMDNASSHSQDNKSTDGDDDWSIDDEDSDDNKNVVHHSHPLHVLSQVSHQTSGTFRDSYSSGKVPSMTHVENSQECVPYEIAVVPDHSVSEVKGTRTVSLMSEESVSFVTPLDSFDTDCQIYEEIHASCKHNQDKNHVENHNGETNSKCDCLLTVTQGSLNHSDSESNDQKPMSIAEKISSFNASLAENGKAVVVEKQHSFVRKLRQSLKKRNGAGINGNDGNDENADEVVSDSVLTIMEALKTFEERANQVNAKKSQLKRKMSAVETHLDKASSLIRSTTNSAGSVGSNSSLESSSNKSDSNGVPCNNSDEITKAQKHFPTGFDEDVTPNLPPVAPEEPVSKSSEKGIESHMGSEVSDKADPLEDLPNGDVRNHEDGLKAPVDQGKGYHYSLVNKNSCDNNVDQDDGENPDSGYGETQVHSMVAGEEPTTNCETDIAEDMAESHADKGNSEQADNVDTVSNVTETGNNAGYPHNNGRSTSEEGNNDYEVISPVERQTANSAADVCTKSNNGAATESVNEMEQTSQATVEQPASLPLKAKLALFEKEQNVDKWKNVGRGEKKEARKDFRKKEEEEVVVRNLLPSEIKKKQTGSSGFKVVRSNVPKKEPRVPPIVTVDPPANPALEVVRRPEGSRRARIIRSFLELERIKKEGNKGADGKPMTITPPSVMLGKLQGSGMKAVSGASGNLRGSDQMLEEMINLQLMQAMGVNPHAIAMTTEDTSAKPQRPSHLEIPAPIKKSKPVKPSSGPSQNIAQMMNRFGDSGASSSPKPAFSSPHSNGKHSSPFGKTTSAPFSKGGLKKTPGKKTPGKNMFNIDVSGGDVEISMKEDNRQVLVNKLASPRGKGKLPE